MAISRYRPSIVHSRGIRPARVDYNSIPVSAAPRDLNVNSGRIVDRTNASFLHFVVNQGTCISYGVLLTFGR
jgi:hypothetical protein